jgi:hypothetical protein
MTDNSHHADGRTPSTASAPRGNPGLHETAGQGDAERFGASASSGSGGAAKWLAWPGVARPAGWFLSASGEAAPPGGFGTEPALSAYEMDRPESRAYSAVLVDGAVPADGAIPGACRLAADGLSVPERAFGHVGIAAPIA